MRSRKVNSVKRQILMLVSLCAALLLLVGCGAESGQSGATVSPTIAGGGGDGAGKVVGKRIDTPTGSYTDLKPAELKVMLDSKDFFLVDVHIPHEGTLPRTDARVRYDQVEENIAAFPSDKNAKIVVTCMSGAMSTTASQTLVRLGYTNVFNLEGGMSAWRRAGYEIVPDN